MCDFELDSIMDIIMKLDSWQIVVVVSISCCLLIVIFECVLGWTASEHAVSVGVDWDKLFYYMYSRKVPRQIQRYDNTHQLYSQNWE